MSAQEGPDNSIYKPFTIIDKVKSYSCHTNREDGKAPYNYIRLWIEDITKTSEVSGFVEHQTFHDAEGTVYIMNDSGKTIASWLPPIE